MLFDDVRYFFYITNDWVQRRPTRSSSAANDRCNQENLLAQLNGGVRALRAPVDNLDEQLGVHGDDGAWPGT